MNALKFISSIFWALVCILFLSFYACKKEEKVNPTPVIVNNPVPIDTSYKIKKVLLEHYTGHYCGNCPSAKKTADTLIKQFPGKVIVLSVHAGFFAQPFSPYYTTSYTTSTGNAWDGPNGFNVTAEGSPKGMVNRKNSTANGLVISPNKWQNSIQAALQDPHVVELKLSAIYSPVLNVLNTNVRARFRQYYPQPVVLNLVLTEDSVIGYQKDYTQSPNDVGQYVFMNMLRADINGVWGSSLKSPPIVMNDTVNQSFRNFSFSGSFNKKNLNVIAIASDSITREVLQVEKVKVQ